MTDLTSSESTSEIGPPKVACIYSHQGMTTEVVNVNFSWNWIENGSQQTISASAASATKYLKGPLRSTEPIFFHDDLEEHSVVAYFTAGITANLFGDSVIY